MSARARHLFTILLLGSCSIGSCGLLGQTSSVLVAEIERVVPIPDSLGLARISGGWTDGTRLILVESQSDQVWKIELGSGDVQRVGRVGQGPGEYLNPRYSGWLGDTIWIADIALRRITLFDEEGRYLRTMMPPPISFQGGGLRVRALLPKGRQLLEASGATGVIVAAGGRDGSLVWFSTEAGEVLTTLMLNRQNEDLTAEWGDGAVLHMSQPFASVDRYDVDPAGHGVWIVTSVAEGVQIEHVDGVGQVTSTLLVRYAAPPLRSADVEAWVDDWLERASSLPPHIPLGPIERALRESLYRPDRWPMFDEVVADPDGAVWLHHPGPTGGSWRRVCESGREDSVRLPPEITMLIPGGGRLLGVRLGAFDVPEVVELKVSGGMPRCETAGSG